MTRRAVLLLLLLAACAHGPRRPRVTLDSGESIELLAVHRLALADGRTTLAVHYRTQLPLEDRAAVERQAAAVRATFAQEIDRVQASRVVMHAHSMHRRWFRTVDRSISVPFEKDETGAWRRAAGR